VEVVAMLQRACRAISVDCVFEYVLGLFRLVTFVHSGLEIVSLCKMLKLKLAAVEGLHNDKTGSMGLGLVNSVLAVGRSRTLIDFG